MLNDIIRFKIHIQGSLEGYEEFVAGEVEREMDDAGARTGAKDGEDEGASDAGAEEEGDVKVLDEPKWEDGEESMEVDQ